MKILESEVSLYPHTPLYGNTTLGKAHDLSEPQSHVENGE